MPPKQPPQPATPMPTASAPDDSVVTASAVEAPTFNVATAADAADVLVEDVLTWRLVGDRLTVVTRDGRKIEVAV